MTDPVTVYLTRDAIDVPALVPWWSGSRRSGDRTFLGVVRDHHDGRPVVRLEYSAYDAMAEAECARIVGEAEARWPVQVALQHRMGALGDRRCRGRVAVGGAPPRRSLRRVPLCHRGGEAPGADLEEGALRRRDEIRLGRIPTRLRRGARPRPAHRRRRPGARPRLEPPARQPAALGHRSVQHAVPLLHAGGGLRLAAARVDPHLRGDRAAWSGSSPRWGSTRSG